MLQKAYNSTSAIQEYTDAWIISYVLLYEILEGWSILGTQWCAHVITVHVYALLRGTDMSVMCCLRVSSRPMLNQEYTMFCISGSRNVH